jgi:hypothetical protein
MNWWVCNVMFRYLLLYSKVYGKIVAYVVVCEFVFWVRRLLCWEMWWLIGRVYYVNWLYWKVGTCCCGRQGFGERQRGTTCTVWRKLLDWFQQVVCGWGQGQAGLGFFFPLGVAQELSVLFGIGFVWIIVLWGVSKDVSLRGLSIVIKWSMGPYSCCFCRMCWAYADCGLLCQMYHICSWKRNFRLRLVCPTYASLQVLQVSLYIPLTVFGFMSREILSLHLNVIFTFVCLKRFVILLICGDT